jgi:hypothetical protein
MKRLLLFVLNTSFIILCAYAQKEQTIGSWKAHLPFSKGLALCEVKNKIYCASSSALFSINKNDNSIEKYDIVDPLSDIDISKIAYSTKHQALIVVYQNSNIDVIVNNKTINISDIKRSSIAAYKKINNIHLADDFAYLATSFGIVVLDLKKMEIKETFIIGPNGTQIEINDITTTNDFIYAASSIGIYKAQLHNTLLNNYNAWNKIDSMSQSNNNCLFLEKLGDALIGISFNGFTKHYQPIALKNAIWSNLGDSTLEKIYQVNETNNKVAFSYENNFQIYNEALEKEFEFSLYEGWETTRPSQVIIDPLGAYWIAERAHGLVRLDNSGWVDRIKPNAPLTDEVKHIAILDKKICVATGGYTAQYSNSWKKNGVYTYNNYTWSHLNNLNSNRFDTIWDIVHTTINPHNTSQTYASAYTGGLIEINNNAVSKIYTPTNSSLQPDINSAEGWAKVSCSSFDEKGNLWVANCNASSPISVKKADGNWKAFYFNGIYNVHTGKLLVTKAGHKWLVLPKSGGILVFSDNGTIDDTSDDVYKKLEFREGLGNLPGTEIYALTEDHNGYVWVGSNQGVSVFYNPSSVLTSNSSFDAQAIKLEQDGNIQLLLETEAISSISVDGANRKWIGTQKGGVFLVSPDGTQQILAFNTQNSPLPSDHIESIAIDGENGEVYFGTEKGIVTFKYDATDGDINYNAIYTYPNPVKNDYDGSIVIKGLMTDTQIKITDTSGKIVFQTTSLGGQAVWDGRDFSGNKAVAGIYLVFANDKQGVHTAVSKFLIQE